MSRPAALTIRTGNDFATIFDVSRETLHQLEIYGRLLQQWQKAVNLVAPSTLDDIWHRHFADSAQLLPLAPPGARTWTDLGSGAGFPGLVVAILLAGVSPEDAAATLLPLGRRWPVVSKTRFQHEGSDEGAMPSPQSYPSPVRPDDLWPPLQGANTRPAEMPATASHGLTSSPPRGEGSTTEAGGVQEQHGFCRITLIESNARKGAFLREVVRQTGIATRIAVDILSTRIETAATQASLPRQDVVSARALAPLDRLLALAAPLFGPETVGLFMKGREAAQDIENARKTWNFSVELIKSRTEPQSQIVLVRQPTPKTHNEGN